MGLRSVIVARSLVIWPSPVRNYPGSPALARCRRPLTENRTIPEATAHAGEGSAAKLNRRLTGDLDDIIMMALRKEPQRRYASVEKFSEDIRRQLEGLPVIARRD